jgi:hypothetical protein
MFRTFYPAIVRNLYFKCGEEALWDFCKHMIHINNSSEYDIWVIVKGTNIETGMGLL